MRTDNLFLPLPAAREQAQKHVTVNEALARLDAVVQLAVLSRGLTAPPARPPRAPVHCRSGWRQAAWAGLSGYVAHGGGGGR